MTSISANSIEWTVPKEWHIRKVRAELSAVFTFGTFARIILVSLPLALGICYWAEKAMGPLDFDWIRAIAISVLWGIGLLFVGAALTRIPPNVRISAKGIDVLKAQGAFRISFSDLVALSIQLSVPPVLTFRKGKRDYRYAIAESVELNRLRQELERLSGRSVQIERTGQPGDAAHASQPGRPEATSEAAGLGR